MKFTLAFCVFNKAHYLESLLHSWLRSVSGEHTYEVVVVCDACHDGSQDVALMTLAQHTKILTRYAVVDTPDVYEIAANNTALQWAAPDSDYILFIQDDNWIFTPCWDTLALKAMALMDKPGALAFLAGTIFWMDGVTYERVEVNTLHKGLTFGKCLVPKEYQPGLYVVDFVTRPFMVSTPALRKYGGLGGPDWGPLCFDDTDLCLKLQQDEHENLYLSLDVLNTAEGLKTCPELMQDSYIKNRDLVLPRYEQFLQWRDDSPFRLVCTLEQLTGDQPIYDM